ncbi:MAG: sulfotransferase [Acidimicrobiia bacterium]
MKPFAFFVGTNGSGTTLHRAIFDSHPELAIPGESQFIVALAGHRARYQGDNGFRSDLVARDLTREHRFRGWGLSEDDVLHVLRAPPPADLPDAIRRVYALYAERQGKTRYADKTQAYIHHLPLLAELFPEARFVHAVRDGRDVALAHTGGEAIERVAMSWKRRVEAGRSAGIQLGASRYIESRFEDLLEDPEKAVRRLCAFLDLEFDPRMLTYYERADAIVATTAAPDRHRDIFLPPTKGLHDWRRDLSGDQVARFEAMAGDLLGELGYDRAYDPVPVGKRIAAGTGLLLDGIGLAAKRIRKRVRRS